MKNISFIRTDIPERTVIFRHPAVSFKLESRIRHDAIFIKEPDLTNKKTAFNFYKNELKRIEKSRKSFVILNYNLIIADYFSSLLSNPNSYEYKNWIFLTFFHEDDETLIVKHKKSVDILVQKTNILSDLGKHQFIRQFSLPLNHILTFHDVLPVLLKSWGYKV